MLLGDEDGETVTVTVPPEVAVAPPMKLALDADMLIALAVVVTDF